MIAVILTVFTVFVVLIALALVAARGRSSVNSVEQLTALSRPVDLDAFRNLISEADERYLRTSLPPRHFRRVERARMLGAFEYVARAAHNSAMLLRLGEAGRRSDNPEIAKAGDELASSALHMRLLCLAALAAISVRIVFPQLRVSPAGICDSYAATRERMVALGRVEQPAFASRIESAL